MREWKTLVRIMTALVLGASLWSSTADAVPMIQGPDNAATGITGLEIGGTIYDVTFSNFGSFDAMGENPPTFLGDQSSATAAATAIKNVLQGVVSRITNLGTGPSYYEIVFVPYAVNTTSIDGAFTDEANADPTVWLGPRTGTYSRTTNYGNISWTSFTIASVPEPGIFWLFTLGLAGIGLARWRAVRRAPAT